MKRFSVEIQTGRLVKLFICEAINKDEIFDAIDNNKLEYLKIVQNVDTWETKNRIDGTEITGICEV